ncbi:hypothetical protein SESBI_45700 [Sesbania bispinosa]|nr:hypothetical protein SESBI_45700 [Sesbania bispinosa]
MKSPSGFASVLSLNMSASAAAATSAATISSQFLLFSLSTSPQPHQTLLSLCCHRARPLQTYNKWTLLCPVCNSALRFVLSYCQPLFFLLHFDRKEKA